VVWVLDAKTGEPAQPPLRVGGTPARLALAAGGVWAGDTGGAAIVSLAPTPGRPMRVGPDVADIAVSGGAVWVASSADGTIRTVERDGTRHELTAGAQLVALAADPGRVVALDAAAATLTTIDARTRALTGAPIAVGGVPIDVALTGDSAWVIDSRAGTVRRYDLTSRRPAGDPITVGRAPVAVAADGADVYVAVGGDRTLVHVRDGKVASRMKVGAVPSAVTLDSRYVWLSAGDSLLLRVSR
jgi:DNA-binding beta-propeller fold protein YncE